MSILGPNLSFQADSGITHNLSEWLRKLKQVVEEVFFAAERAQGSAGAAANSLGQIQKLVNVTKVKTGSWTPSVSFVTAGDLAVTYSEQIGHSVRIGNLVIASFSIITSSFTHTTASGALEIEGFPFSGLDSASTTGFYGTGGFGGITKANYTQFAWVIADETRAFLRASGSGQVTALVTTADVPTGGDVVFTGTLIYEIDPGQ